MMLSLYDHTFPQLSQFLAEWGFAAVHAKRLWKYLYRELAVEIAAMTELPPRLLARLQAGATLGNLHATKTIVSNDGSTHKFLLNLADGEQIETVQMEYGTGETQRDAFTIHVLPPAPPKSDGPAARIALFDPPGETTALLKSLGVEARSVNADADLSGVDLLVIGKAALTADGPAPRLDRVRDGLKVVVFEQTAEALERRLGFRVAEYGLRQVFPRVPDHPILAGLGVEHLRDWRGEATILPPRLEYEPDPRRGPTVVFLDRRP